MTKGSLSIGIGAGLLVIIAALVAITSATVGAKGTQSTTYPLSEAVTAVKAPSVKKPKWYIDKKAQVSQPAASASSDRKSTSLTKQTVTYTVSTKGSTVSSYATFASQVNQTLNDSRGWAQLGIHFKQVKNGGSFNLILSQPSLVPSFSSGCSSEWSCRVGVSVIINDMRWNGATPAWNNAGGNIRDYRHMVVNHEVGHWLGHGHQHCAGAGNSAPVMQQQSISLEGCSFNPWPHKSELWTSRPDL